MDTKKFISEGYRLFAAGDLQGLLARFNDDAEMINPDSDYLPIGGSYHGTKEIAEFFMKLNETTQCTALETKTMVQEGDTLVVTGESSWIARSTGVPYDNPFVHVFKVQGGKIAALRVYYDTSKLEHALQPASAGKPAGNALHH
ncbi:nuclear transport factor 2 family protein [Pseudoduganella violaceinigra]|uniref:nuclear transport factor 2 family protein n=1 Tax=Pseudoduganella violaceinigra TaxID=246602 RepID=UPI0003FE775F|nr:nuclear transport factor 2 family protein [Pseudoduganella violaceinigra]